MSKWTRTQTFPVGSLIRVNGALCNKTHGAHNSLDDLVVLLSEKKRRTWWGCEYRLTFLFKSEKWTMYVNGQQLLQDVKLIKSP